MNTYINSRQRHREPVARGPRGGMQHALDVTSEKVPYAAIYSHITSAPPTLTWFHPRQLFRPTTRANTAIPYVPMRASVPINSKRYGILGIPENADAASLNQTFKALKLNQQEVATLRWYTNGEGRSALAIHALSARATVIRAAINTHKQNIKLVDEEEILHFDQIGPSLVTNTHAPPRPHIRITPSVHTIPKGAAEISLEERINFLVNRYPRSMNNQQASSNKKRKSNRNAHEEKKQTDNTDDDMSLSNQMHNDDHVLSSQNSHTKSRMRTSTANNHAHANATTTQQRTASYATNSQSTEVIPSSQSTSSSRSSIFSIFRGGPSPNTHMNNNGRA